MPLIEAFIAPIAKIIDKVIPDPQARDRAKLELLKLEGSQELDAIERQLSAILAEAQSSDPWTSRARPSFLYVMYALLLWSIPMGLIASVRPETAFAIANGMNAYLAGLPEPYICLIRHGLSWLYCCQTMGKMEGNRQIVAKIFHQKIINVAWTPPLPIKRGF